MSGDRQRQIAEYGEAYDRVSYHLEQALRVMVNLHGAEALGDGANFVFDTTAEAQREARRRAGDYYGRHRQKGER